MRVLDVALFYVLPYLVALGLIFFPRKVQKFFAWSAGLMPRWLQGPFTPQFAMWEGWAVWFRIQGFVVIIIFVWFHCFAG